MFQAKDFIETGEGLLFAVVSPSPEADRVLAFLRYRQVGEHWCKLDSDDANALLTQNYPHYLHYSPLLDADLHGVALSCIKRHHQPRVTLKHLLNAVPVDAVVGDLQQLCRLLEERGVTLERLGVTGSLLVAAQHHSSDIDLVCYERDEFQRTRLVVQDLIAHNKLQALNDEDWLQAYHRRGCDFPLDEYIWHEQRKYNKAMINQRKFDLSLVTAQEPVQSTGRKLGSISIQAVVVDDQRAFDYPARYGIDHPDIDEVLSFTATYSGQAQRGECIEVAGQLEIDDHDCQRVIVGSNREAIGEFIRVLR